MRSLATQLSLGYKTNADIDQAMDFTYKLDRKIFQNMITNMDWIEESEIRKFQLARKVDHALIHVTTTQRTSLKLSREPTRINSDMKKRSQAP